MEQRRMMARAAGRIQHPTMHQPLEQAAIERLLVGQPPRPVDDASYMSARSSNMGCNLASTRLGSRPQQYLWVVLYAF